MQVYCRTHLRSYRAGGFKLVRDFLNPGRDELYDLESDPAENDNCFADEQAWAHTTFSAARHRGAGRRGEGGQGEGSRRIGASDAADRVHRGRRQVRAAEAAEWLVQKIRDRMEEIDDPLLRRI